MRVALEKMPKTGHYLNVSNAVASFEQAYENVEKSGCYTSKGKALGTQKTLRRFCYALASGVALSWLNLRSAISQLEKSG
ncbi:hypothetical protein OHR68_26400 [Spirillospora sp. NBC_00431]